MKLLSFQPFSLYANGGGSRILRRLYQGKENQVISLAVEAALSAPGKGEIDEITVVAVPAAKPWMRWYVRNIFIWLREKALRFWTIKRIQKAASVIAYDVLHIVDHGPFSAALCTGRFCEGRELWVSFHDHFSTMRGNFRDTQQLWNKANRRLVISNELANKYQQLFGDQPFELITDGVAKNELSAPEAIIESPVIVYFAGLLHLEYRELFSTLADALDLLTKQGLSFKLLLRGTQVIDFLNSRLFETVYMPLSLDDDELKKELDIASILYLPIKFTIPDFYLYSLSTKMIGYLGGKGAILYHGPADSAACVLLNSKEAAICCTTLNVDNMVNALTQLINNKESLSAHAKILAADNFSMETIRQQFWQPRN